MSKNRLSMKNKIFPNKYYANMIRKVPVIHLAESIFFCGRNAKKFEMNTSLFFVETRFSSGKVIETLKNI